MEEGLGRRCHLGTECACGLQAPFLRMHQHYKSTQMCVAVWNVEPLLCRAARLFFFFVFVFFLSWSLRFMSKQDNRSSGIYCFPSSLRSLHADISGFVASKYTLLMIRAKRGLRYAPRYVEDTRRSRFWASRRALMRDVIKRGNRWLKIHLWAATSNMANTETELEKAAESHTRVKINIC